MVAMTSLLVPKFLSERQWFFCEYYCLLGRVSPHSHSIIASEMTSSYLSCNR